jgi:hypothetical protein
MRKSLAFWWRCAVFAAQGNVPHANDWQWVLANPLWQSIGTAVGAVIGAWLKSVWADAPVIAPDTWAGVLLGGLAGFVITWLMFFIVRLVHAPAAIFHAERERADELQRQLDAGDNTKRSNIDQLQKFYSSGHTLSHRLKSVRGENVPLALEDVGGWRINTAQWIAHNMGDAANTRFVDLGGLKHLFYVADDNHNGWILRIDRWCENLKVLIERYDDWYRH